ncbi:MAG: hypothetical protein ACI36V_07455 [Coriobacteriales bacterium]
MCFRPAATVNIVKCLECGAFNKPSDATCKKCGTDLGPSLKAAQDAIATAGTSAPAEISLTPQGLGDRKPPAVPGAPAAPGAPKPPQA